jgi:hypothetical protein
MVRCIAILTPLLTRLYPQTRKQRETWSDAVKRQRRKHVLLNFFTVNQMMALHRDCCKALAARNSGADAVHKARILRSLQYAAPLAGEEQVKNIVDAVGKKDAGTTGASSATSSAPLSGLNRTHSLLTEKLVAEGAWAEGIDHVAVLGGALQEALGGSRPRFRPLAVLEGKVFSIPMYYVGVTVYFARVRVLRWHTHCVIALWRKATKAVMKSGMRHSSSKGGALSYSASLTSSLPPPWKSSYHTVITVKNAQQLHIVIT